jgi:hypothetical protein
VQGRRSGLHDQAGVQQVAETSLRIEKGKHQEVYARHKGCNFMNYI